MNNYLYLEGVEAFNKHDYQTAKNLLLQAIEENPEASESYFFLGKSYFFCDEKNAAIDHIKKYIALNQPNADKVANIPHAFDLLGQCYEACNKDAAAITCYTTAIKINPLTSSAWHNLGLLYTKLSQHDLERDLANSFKMLQKAQSFLKKALEICSTNPMFLNSVASWYEKYIEALEKLTEETEAVQQNKDNHFKLAIEYYQKALTACDENDIALRNIIKSNLIECLAQYGHHCYRAENYEKALGFYKQAFERDPTHLVVLNQIGMSLFKQTHYSEARQYFLMILENTVDSQELADAWLNISCTYRMEKSWANAENALNDAKKLAPEDPTILEEEQQLMDARSQARLTVAPQMMFSHPSTGDVPSVPSEENRHQLS